MGKCIIISAPSGAGKTTLVHFLLKEVSSLEFSVSACSRLKRSHETDGKDYFFMSSDEFRHKIISGELLESQEVYPGMFYGTLKSEVKRIFDAGKNIIFDVDVVGGLNLKRIFAGNALSVFVQPPSLEVLKERLETRKSETSENIQRRIAKAEKEMKTAIKFDQIIINDDLERTCAELKQMVEGFLKKTNKLI